SIHRSERCIVRMRPWGKNGSRPIVSLPTLRRRGDLLCLPEGGTPPERDRCCAYPLDRIGKWPWQNAKGDAVAKSVEDLHSGSANINKQTAVTEKCEAVSVSGLGLMFNNGQGVQADHTKAAMWYKRAADLGNTYGMVNLGFVYQQGKGVE